MIGREEKINVFHLLGERCFLKKLFYMAYFWGFLEGNHGFGEISIFCYEVVQKNTNYFVFSLDCFKSKS